MKTYLYLVRHGSSPSSLEHERIKVLSLSEQGKEDSAKVADMLKNEGIDVIVSSPYLRAVETVSPLADLLNKEITEYEQLRESPIANLKYEVPQNELLDAIQRSFVDVDYCKHEGETTRQAQERAIPVIKKLLSEHRGKKIVIGTHGNIMTIILHYFDRSYGFEFWKQITNPDIYKLEFEETELREVTRIWT